MNWKFWRLIRKRNLNPQPLIDEREIEALRRENLEASGQTLKDGQIEAGNSIDKLSAPGVVTGLGSIVARTAKEQRARNRRI